jgi:O-antigen ligase
MLYRLAYYGLLIVAPLLLGSNRPPFWALNGIVAAFVVAGFAWSELSNLSSDRFDWRLPRTALLAMLVLGIWIAAQASTWTPKAWHHPIWSASPMLVGAKGAISADPSLTWQALTWWSALSVFVVAARIGTNAARCIFLLELMLTICVSVALFGLAVERFGLSTLGFFPKTYYTGWLTGTFVNRNSAASFIGIGLIIAIALASSEYRARKAQISAFNIFDFADIAAGRTGTYGIAAIILFAALLLTGSRGGIGTAIIGGATMVILDGFKQRRHSLPSIAMVAAGVGISITLALYALQGRQDVADSATVRLGLYAEALRAISDRPFLGHGAGTYSSIEPLYHGSATPSDLVWDNAHSTVLEVIVTLGIPAVLFAASILAFIIFRLARAWWNASGEATCLLATLGVCLAVALHAVVDFSLEMQAIALYVSSLIGLGIGEAMRLGIKARHRNAKTQQARIRAQASID